MKMYFNRALLKPVILVTVIATSSCSFGEEKVQNDKTSSQYPALIDPNAAETLMKSDVVILDVRTDEEVAEGTLPGAVQMDISDWNGFRKGVDTLDKSQPILVYCKAGGRSSKAADYLRAEGFEKIHDLEGGIVSWIEADKPLIKP